MRTPTALMLAVLVAGCASKSEDVMATYVSPVQYQNYSCDQLGREAQALSVRAAQLAGQQDSDRTTDAVMTGVGIVVFWPVLFAIGGDGPTTAELARVRGEMEAIRHASNAKNCGIVFQERPV
jgi:hypothetical protein